MTMEQLLETDKAIRLLKAVQDCHLGMNRDADHYDCRTDVREAITSMQKLLNSMEEE